MAVDNVKEYWDNRYAKQGFNTTGFIGHNSEENKKCYAERIEFLKPLIHKHDKWDSLILDYGCGVGWYFDMLYDLYGYYVGYDVNEWAVRYCIDEHLESANVLNIDFVLDEPNDCDTLFTATVLQHNSNAEVSRILNKYKEAETFLLYEFTGVTNAPHMAERSVNDYAKLVARSANKKLIEEHTHNVHGEQHSLMIFQ